MDNSAILSRLVDVMQRASTLATEARPTSTRAKAHQDHVTDVDLKLDAFLQQKLGEITPGVPVLSEERACDVAAPVDRWWIVDPLDGTGNLVAGLPLVAIAVALVDRDGPLLAAVAAPFQDSLWTAIRGGGAWLDGESLALADAPAELIVISSGVLERLRGPDTETIWSAFRSAGKIRNLGAQALQLCGVASGWFGAAISTEAKVWDEAAGGLIVREAGGIWHSVADEADWRDPAALMAIKQQNSLACHPALERALLPPVRQLLYQAGNE